MFKLKIIKYRYFLKELKLEFIEYNYSILLSLLKAQYFAKLKDGITHFFYYYLFFYHCLKHWKQG